MYKIINFIKDIIAPKRCYSCNKEWHFLCSFCDYKLPKLNPYCYICKKETSNFEIHKSCQKNFYFDKVIVYNHYKENLIKKLIKDSKFFNKKDILEDLSFYLSNKFLENENIFNKDNYLILPVPMNFFRRIKKWYNQSEILASEISRITWIDYNKNVLKRIKNTKQQSLLSKKERESNLLNVFKINKKYIKNLELKKVILVDDVISTWSTINEISKILKQNWVLKIIWLCVASD